MTSLKFYFYYVFFNLDSPMKSTLSDEEVMRAYLPHQPVQCLEVLYNRYASKVYRHCFSITKQSALSEDFTHDIFLKVLNNLDSFEYRSSFSSWLYSISFNYCSDQLRLSRRLPLTQLDITDKLISAESSEALYPEEDLHLIWQALNKLTLKNRLMLKLKYEDGLSIEKIAQLHALSLSAVKMRLKRSREKVQLLCTLL